MPKKHKKNHQEKSKKMPVVFYHSIPKEKIFPEPKEDQQQPVDFSKNTTPNYKQERQIWLYIGVGTVMAALLFFWGKNIPEMIKTAPAESAAQNLFEKNSNSLAAIFNDQKTTSEQIKKTLINAANQFASSTLTEKNSTSTPVMATSTISSTTTIQLTPQQLTELKSKLNINKK